VIQVKQHLRPMRGGAQSHLMFAEDGHYYVVKFQNNPNIFEFSPMNCWPRASPNV
jgi:hypothetical protein